MGRLSGFGSFVLITATLFLGLRGLHLAIGALHPASLPGPFELGSLAETERHAGFWPHVPFYRSARLGAGPPEIVAWRRPYPAVTVQWLAESHLKLEEWDGGFRPPLDETAAPLPGAAGVLYWRTDGELVAVLELAGRWIRLSTDLDRSELRRIVDTLLPYDRLL